jgi:F-type H+-transporting ATPase subunit b
VNVLPGMKRALLLVAALVLVVGLCAPALATSEEAPGEGPALENMGVRHDETATEEHAASGEKVDDLIYRVMNFAVMAIALFFILRKPLSNALAQRTEGIKTELEDLEAKREEALKEVALLEERIRSAEGEREEILSDFRAQGEREKQSILDSAHTMAERIKAQAQFTIEQETQQAKAELRKEIADLSASLAEDMLKQNINDDDQHRLVNEYLDKVGQEAS